MPFCTKTMPPSPAAATAAVSELKGCCTVPLPPAAAVELACTIFSGAPVDGLIARRSCRRVVMRDLRVTSCVNCGSALHPPGAERKSEKLRNANVALAKT